MKGRHQRRTLTASGHIPATEIGDDIDAAILCQQSRIIRLPGITKIGAMADCLAMCTDGAYRIGRQAGLLEQLGDAVGIDAYQGIGGQRFTLQFIGAGSLQGHQLASQIGREG